MNSRLPCRDAVWFCHHLPLRTIQVCLWKTNFCSAIAVFHLHIVLCSLHCCRAAKKFFCTQLRWYPSASDVFHFVTPLRSWYCPLGAHWSLYTCTNYLILILYVATVKMLCRLPLFFCFLLAVPLLGYHITCWIKKECPTTLTWDGWCFQARLQEDSNVKRSTLGYHCFALESSTWSACHCDWV